MSKNGTLYRIANQGIAAYVDYLRNIRIDDLMSKIQAIAEAESDELADIALRERTAQRVLSETTGKIDALIDINRGGSTGVHGFIAEQAEGGITKARRAFDGIRNCTTVINNNGPADLHIGQHNVQMKFYNNLSNEIKAAAEYRNMNMMYSKDHVEIFRKIMAGENHIEFDGNELSQRKIDAIRKLIDDESKERGESFEKWMEASKLDYDDVQKENIHERIAEERESIRVKADSDSSEVRDKATSDKVEAFQEARPSFGEATKAAGAAMAVQGGINFGMYVYEQHKQGKEIWQFDADNWKQAGIQTGKGVLKGGISGYSIYYLTNACQLSAPSAGAIASGTFGIANAVISHRTGELDDDGFIDAILFNAIDSTGAAAGAALGQALIPVPVVGAVVGSIVASTALSLGKGFLSRQEEALIKKYENSISAYIATLDAEYGEKYARIMKQYKVFGEIQNRAFDLDTNVKLRFDASIEMAQMLGVEEEKILHNVEEVDAFFM